MNKNGDIINHDEQGEAEEKLKSSFSRRVFIAGAVVFAGFAGLISRLFYLQILRHKHFSTRSQANRIRVKAITPERGMIYDRKGTALTENIVRYRVVVQPFQTANIRETLNKLREFIPLSDEEINDFLKNYRKVRRYESAVIKNSIGEQERYRLEVQLHQLDGVEIESYHERYYPFGAQLSHVVGYTNRISEQDNIEPEKYSGLQYIGRTGLEKQYEDRLRGQSGYQQVEADVNGNLVRVLDEKAAVRGQDLYLSLDADLQRYIFEVFGEHRGSCVAINPENGEVLALVSTPSYDANLFVSGISSKNYQRLANDTTATPLYNRALKGKYSPGSVIKPVMSLAGFHYRIFSTHTSVHCTGNYSIPDSSSKRRFHCWNRNGHGWVNADRAMAQSCDVYYYTLGYQLGIDRMAEFANYFSLGKQTGIDLPEESSGIMPTRDWKLKISKTAWFIGDTINASIGQGYVTTTPLQLAYMTALIARDGVPFTPHLLKQIYDPTAKTFQTHQVETHKRLHIYDAIAWKHVKNSMENVIHSSYGTARGIAKDIKYRMAGKSGTVQVISFQNNRRPEKHEIKKEHQDNAMFIAYAPARNPKIALSIIVERGGGGSSTAAPMARKIIDYYLGFIDENSLETP